MTFEKITLFALVGTARTAWAIVDTANASLAPALAATQAADTPEDQLLGAAALLATYEICGASSPKSERTSAPSAAPDRLVECSARAGELLRQILPLSAPHSKTKLIDEWLRLAEAAAQRAPHELLPALLEYGAAHRDAREAILRVADERGRWLMSMNPRWQYAAADDEAAETIWATGNRDQRVAALRRLRVTDPPKALELVESTWKEDGADERALFVHALQMSLRKADESFLEAALDDRSKQVRSAAAQILSRLPGSALVARMIVRVEPLLAYTPLGKAGLLRKGTPASIQLTLPPDQFDPTWARDGVIEVPAGRVGKRQWWARQMLSAIPPTHWSQRWQLKPQDCVLAASGDHAELILDSWTEAAERHQDVAWIQALLAHSLSTKGAEPKFGLLSHLSEEQQRTLLPNLLSANLGAPALAAVLNSLSGELDEKLALSAIAAVERLVAAGKGAYIYALPTVLDSLAYLLPTGFDGQLTQRWIGPAWDLNRKSLETFFQTLQTRKHLQTEFGQ